MPNPTWVHADVLDSVRDVMSDIKVVIKAQDATTEYLNILAELAEATSDNALLDDRTDDLLTDVQRNTERQLDLVERLILAQLRSLVYMARNPADPAANILAEDSSNIVGIVGLDELEVDIAAFKEEVGIEV